MNRIKMLILNIFSICIIGLGSAFLMQNNAQATTSLSPELLAECADGTCGETCTSGTVNLPIVGDVTICSCTGPCTEEKK